VDESSLLIANKQSEVPNEMHISPDLQHINPANEHGLSPEKAMILQLGLKLYLNVKYALMLPKTVSDSTGSTPKREAKSGAHASNNSWLHCRVWMSNKFMPELLVFYLYFNKTDF
jgi:hypothetical protein